MIQLGHKEDEFLQILTLSGMRPLAGERTLQAFYYILRGRKANQTYQDVHMFRLHPYYRLFPQLQKERWEEIVGILFHKNLIQAQQMDARKTSFIFTEQGEKELAAGRNRYRLEEWFAPFYRIPEAVRMIPVFWLKMHLMVQTVSFLLADNSNFYPLVQDKQVQTWVKQQLRGQSNRKAWLDGLSGELYTLLDTLPAEIQLLIVRQFAGANQTACTVQQLAYLTNQPPSLILVKWRYGLAAIMEKLLVDGEERFPLLSRLMSGGKEQAPRLSKSAQETYRLLVRNLGLEEIARLRKITRNTVEDHLVEIALQCPDWDTSPYLSKADQETILAVSDALRTRRLRLIKDRLGDQYTFLQIRLALAKKEGGGGR
jgi:uncharacterized protein YpbB